MLAAMNVRIVTIFPGFFASCLGEGLLGKAAEKGLVQIEVDDLRAYTADKHRTVDDVPYGGGAGMVMKVDVWAAAIEAARAAHPGARVILLSPQGATLDDAAAVRLARESALVFCCGRYEGVDERVAEHLIDEELSIGDYVLTGGEAAALVAVDAIARKLPGVVGRSESVETDTFTAGLKFPQYTRPPKFHEWSVPSVLQSGDHQKIEAWRAEQSHLRTAARRPDLAALSAAGKVRLLLENPDKATLTLALSVCAEYGLRELAVCLADIARKEELRAEHCTGLHVYGHRDRAIKRWKDETFIQLAHHAGPGQKSLAQIRRVIAESQGKITIGWGDNAPTGAIVAAPAFDQGSDIAALLAWLDRLFGRR